MPFTFNNLQSIVVTLSSKQDKGSLPDLTSCTFCLLGSEAFWDAGALPGLPAVALPDVSISGGSASLQLEYTVCRMLIACTNIVQTCGMVQICTKVILLHFMCCLQDACNHLRVLHHTCALAHSLAWTKCMSHEHAVASNGHMLSVCKAAMQLRWIAEQLSTPRVSLPQHKQYIRHGPQASSFQGLSTAHTQ